MYKRKTFNIIFFKRSLICFITIILLFFTTILRLAEISLSNHSAVYSTQNGIRLTIGKTRGTIYDCNNIPLTNSKKNIVAALSPTPRVITAISQVLKGEELNHTLNRLKDGKPILCELPYKIECDGIICFDTYSSPEIPALHLLGYTDEDKKGISGIQKAYNEILENKTDLSVFYPTDAKGRILEGAKPEIENNSNWFSDGVVTTIDINIQSITEKYAENLEKGAIIIAETESGKIRGYVSRPTFNPENISNFLNNNDSPLLDRCLNAYNVGSVFKPCVAIAGIEQGVNFFQYNCTGSCEIVDRFFKCHSISGHGNLDLQKALAFSCNTYFYNFAFKIGKEKIFNTAKTFNFGQSLKLGKDIFTSKGNLPEKNTLSNIAYLANFSIGQGELLLSPISILTLYCAIANDGEYYIPSVIEATIKDGTIEKYNNGAPTKAINKNTAKTLKSYLNSVLLEGTGKEALPKTVTAAGKTATAQTGRYKNNTEICQGWFCGFFPLEQPKYTVVIFSEDISLQKESCSKIFSLIADEISQLKNPT